MKISILKTRHLSFVALLFGLLGNATIAGAEFSAEMSSRGPDGKVSSGKIFVSDGRVRTEMSHQGRRLVRIRDENRGIEWILFPEQKSYMEQPLVGPSSKTTGAWSESGDDPCKGMPGLTCRKLGEEQIRGRSATKWEIVASRQGEVVTTTQWVDKERGIPLRQEMPNGVVSEFRLLGKEDLGGRQVEKWEFVAKGPGQQETQTFQWFDPELGLAIRQEFPGGMVSELTNIRIGDQPDELFHVPAGFERLSAPQGMDGSAGAETERR